MTTIDTGTTGAKRQTWRHGNPRELLKHIIDELATTDREKLLREFTDQVFAAGNQPVLETIVEYWFANNLNSLLDKSAFQVQREAARMATQQKTAAVRKEIVQTITAVAGAMLLDMALPHGKTLRNSTGAECAAIGGWLSLIGSKISPDAVVGNVLSEEQVRDLFARMNGR